VSCFIRVEAEHVKERNGIRERQHHHHQPMEYVLEDNKEDQEEDQKENENTYANASGISLAVSPWSRKYSLILPILIFRSSKIVAVVDIFLWCLSVVFPNRRILFQRLEV